MPNLLIKLFCLKSYIESEAIFGIYRVDLHNRILISTWLDDINFSTSTTVRPKLRKAGWPPFMDRFGWNFLCDLRVTPYNKYVCPRILEQLLVNSGPSTVWHTKKSFQTARQKNPLWLKGYRFLAAYASKSYYFSEKDTRRIFSFERFSLWKFRTVLFVRRRREALRWSASIVVSFSLLVRQ